ncbi:MAG: methyltransferase domain-containing protein [Proteobacteria bacterium]|nr:methyltransferase domain-containing protein [Pseudomonadota bacterium]
MEELEKIRQNYIDRDRDLEIQKFWSIKNPVALHLLQERERAVIRGMMVAGIDFDKARLLDVGCGRAQEFASYLRWGASGGNLFGVDLSEHRVQEAHDRGVGTVKLGSGTDLPFESDFFDIVVQNVTFSSVTSVALRRQIASEMLRVLRPGGWVLWYDADTFVSRDPSFKEVTVDEVERIFPDVIWEWQRVTTHLGLLTRLHRWFGDGSLRMFDLLGFLKTHRLGWGRYLP